MSIHSIYACDFTLESLSVTHICIERDEYLYFVLGCTSAKTTKMFHGLTPVSEGGARRFGIARAGVSVCDVRDLSGSWAIPRGSPDEFGVIMRHD